MANEIVELRRTVIGKQTSGADLLSFDALFLYPVDPPILVKGLKYPLSPRGGLPPGVEQYLLITPEELAALDEGDLAFHYEPGVDQRDGETLVQLLARVRRVYEKRRSFIDRARSAFANTGARYNATT